LCAAYRAGGSVVTEFPASLRLLQECEPVYEELEGWQQDTSEIRREEDLPPAARRFLQRITELTGIPVVMVSVGPDREQTVVLRDVFFSPREKVSQPL